MLKLLSGTALAMLLITPVWGQSGSYGEPLHRMEVQVCGGANGSPGCLGVEEWGVAPELGLPDVSEVQPGVVTGQDFDEWMPDAGRGSTGARSVSAGEGDPGATGSGDGSGDAAAAAGDTGTGDTGTGDTGTSDTSAGDTGGDTGTGDTGTGDTGAGDISGGTS